MINFFNTDVIAGDVATPIGKQLRRIEEDIGIKDTRDSSGCGGDLTGNQTGYILSPRQVSLPEFYPSDASCTWTMSCDGPILLYIESFELERSSSCEDHDYVEIHDGNNGTKYCGSLEEDIEVEIIFIDTGNLSVTFVSDHYVNAEGFQILYVCDSNTIICGETMEGPSGVIHSPSWPNNYPCNHLCEWYIKCDDGSTPLINVNWGTLKNMAIEWEKDAQHSDGDYTNIIEPGRPLMSSQRGQTRNFGTDRYQIPAKDRYQIPATLGFRSDGFVDFSSMNICNEGPGFKITYECPQPSTPQPPTPQTTTPQTTTPQPPECVDKRTQKFCKNQLKKNKCELDTNKKNCALTCGHC